MDVSKFCRSCMEEVAPWESENPDEKTMEMFSFCTKIETTNESLLPKNFCYNCTVLLESFYIYVKKARRVDIKLKKLVQNKNNSFVEHFLSQTAELDKLSANIDVNNYYETEINDIKTNINDYNYDHDIFDEEDDKCLAELKTEKLENEIKKEPLEDENNENFTIVKDEHFNNVETEPVTEPVKDNGHRKNGHRKKAKFTKQCGICRRVFNKKGWYHRHMKQAHGDGESEKDIVKNDEGQKETKDTGDPSNEIKCRICNKVFKSKVRRTTHLNEVHSQSVDGKRVFLCPYCPKTFSKYSHMYYHTTSHPDVVKHPCPTCGKEYRIKKELEQHIRTHMTSRPYACDKCDMSFKLKGVLAMHLKWHDGIRPHLCSICGKSFLQSGNLESHMRVHTDEKPFTCTQCSFRTNSRVSLKRHLLRHRGERPFPCSYCPKRFYESCSLTRHVRSHTRERPYRCPYCSRDFRDSGKRRRHFIKTHKMAPDEIPAMDKDGGSVERSAQHCGRKRQPAVEQ